MTPPCILCGNTQNSQSYTAKEMQLGLDEYFEYQLCGNCGSIQLQEIPDDLARYYPNEDYYSFKLATPVRKKADTLRKIKTDYLLFGKHTLLGSLLSIGYKMPEELQWMKDTGARYDDAILDIGTGSGNLLARLFQVGFTNLTGIDPFINASHDLGAIRILKKNIYEVTEQYDLVMMHHSLEHMPEPLAVLQQAKKITKPGGTVMIRIPIMGNYGWQQYGIFWGGIDAPRHIFIPSEKQMRILAEQAGFVIEKFYYDSPVSMIWISEQHNRGMHLYHADSYLFHTPNSLFSKKDIRHFRSILEKENQKGNGDTAVFCLRNPLQ